MTPPTGPRTSTNGNDPVVDFLVRGDAPPLSICVFSSLPVRNDILSQIKDVCCSARRLPALPPSQWKASIQSAWSLHLPRIGDVMQSALKAPTMLNLFNALWFFLASPATVLGPLFSEPTGARQFDSPDQTVNAALSKVVQGQERKAFKLLCSNGVASTTPAVIAAIKDLHPNRDYDLVLPKPNGFQLTLDTDDLSRSLFQSAARECITKDVYGWSSALLFHVRGEKGGVFDNVVQFFSLLANSPALFPPICAELLSAGLLTPLHKLSAIDRKEGEEAGAPPKVRPINAGSMMAKTLMSALLKTPAAERAAARVQPYQLSLGCKRGCERMVHTCRAANSKKWLLGKNDFINGFNSLDRQVMLDEHDRLFPESTQLFNFFYGVDAPVILFDEDSEMVIVDSKQGARQGCSIGTEAFCLALDKPIREVHSDFDEFIIKVLTDDVVLLCPPPEDVTSREAWIIRLRRYAAALTKLKDSVRMCRLSMNPSKGALLLPPECPDPDTETLALFPTGFRFLRDGVVIAGAPIGNDAFILDFVAKKVTEARLKLPAVEAMARKDPRASHRLLSSCVTKLHSYLSVTVPPQYIMTSVRDFDSEVSDVFFRVISPHTELLKGTDARMVRARLKASLPAPNGCGLFATSDQCAVGWWASVQACLTLDPDLFSLKDGLSRFVPPAWTLLTKALGGVESVFWLQLSHLFPAAEQGLLDGSRFVFGVSCEQKVTKAVLKVISRKKMTEFSDLTSRENVGFNFTRADYVLTGARSPSGYLFAETYKYKTNNVFNKDTYINFVRFYLGLPPIPKQQPKDLLSFDYPVSECLSHPGRHMDAAACHASACTSAAKAKQHKHTRLVGAIMSAATEAGLESAREPDTYSLLKEAFSRADCRRVFPKGSSQTYKKAFRTLQDFIDQCRHPSCKIPSDQQQLIKQKLIDALPTLDKSDTHGLRVDIRLYDPKTDEEKWIDVTSVNTAADSYVDLEMRHTMDKLASLKLACEVKVPNLPMRPSPTLVARERIKIDKYSRLISVADKQFFDHERKTKPTFVPFAMSTAGELGPEAYSLQEWLVEKYRLQRKAEKNRPDGQTTRDLVLDFRRRLRMSLQFAMAAGMGQLIAEAGCAESAAKR